MSTFRLSIAAIALLVSVAAFASQSNDSSSQPQKNESSVTESSLTKADMVHAKQWKLSAEEYERYKQILKSPRAYFTPDLDKNPLLALALESESEIDKQRYADKWVQIQFENNIKVISWQLEVSEAWERAFPGVPRFAYKNPETAHYAVSNMNKPVEQADIFSNANTQPSLEALLQAKPRAQLYLGISSCEGCIEAFQRQYELLKKGKYIGLDIHFVGNPTKEQIIEWARARVSDSGLDAADNQSRVLTLNTAQKEVTKVPFVEFD